MNVLLNWKDLFFSFIVLRFATDQLETASLLWYFAISSHFSDMACSSIISGCKYEYGKYLIVSFVLAMDLSAGSTVSHHRLDQSTVAASENEPKRTMARPKLAIRCTIGLLICLHRGQGIAWFLAFFLKKLVSSWSFFIPKRTLNSLLFLIVSRILFGVNLCKAVLPHLPV